MRNQFIIIKSYSMKKSKKKAFAYRDAGTGRFVSKKYAEENWGTTVRERRSEKNYS